MSSSGLSSAFRSAGGRLSRVASAVVGRAVTAQHKLKVEGYSNLGKILANGDHIACPDFHASGHNWRIAFFPNGGSPKFADHVSVFLHHVPTVQADAPAVVLPATVRFSLLDHAGEPVAPYSFAADHRFGVESPCTGFEGFIKKEELEKSEHLKDDCFAVLCEITIREKVAIEQILEEEEPRYRAMAEHGLKVPPSNLHHHLYQLLWRKDTTDVTLRSHCHTFSAHNLILKVRAPLLAAELKKDSAAMWGNKDDDTFDVKIEPKVLEPLLHFIYTDDLPYNIDEWEDATEVVQGLVAAAVKYKLERLEFICVEKLLKVIDTSTVVTIMTTAERHKIEPLRVACMQFVNSPGKLQEIMAADGFIEKIKQACPPFIAELIFKNM